MESYYLKQEKQMNEFDFVPTSKTTRHSP